MESKYIELRKRRTFSEVMNAIIEFAKREYKGMLKAQLYITGPSAIIASILGASLFDAFFTLGFTGDASAFTVEVVAYFIGMMVFTIIAQTFVTAVSLDYIYIYVNEKPEEITPGMVWARSKNTFWGVLVHTLFLIFLLVIAYLVIFGGFFAMITLISEFLFILFLIPVVAAIYLAGVLSIYFPVYVYEKRGLDFPTVIRRCFFLVKDHWWKTFGVFMITSIVVGTISSIFFLPPYFAFIFTVLSDIESGADISGKASLWMTFFYVLYYMARFILGFLILSGTAIQYFNLVEYKEATGLMETIQSIDSEDTNTRMGADRAGDTEHDEDY